jgi:short subunit dehydrogenase-like uncharacterized protein
MRLLIYGAYGYTGTLVARLATERGQRPVLAGRRAEPLAALAGELDLPYRVVKLTDPTELATALGDVDVVAHCAGPFGDTAEPMVRACLQARTHYIDITGELDVFEWIFEQDEPARASGIALLPGAGFDVVPTDCLAARLARRLPGADTLELAFSTRGGISGGTYLTRLQEAASGAARRIDGKLVPTPPGEPSRRVPFRSGARVVGATRWGDLVTAFRSTGIPNITVYAGVPSRAGRLARVMRTPAARWLANRTVPPGGPDDEIRARTGCEVWGEVRDTAGRAVSATLVGPHPYDLTADAVVRIAGYLAARRGPAGPIPPGAHTPATALGADFVNELTGVVIIDD